MDALGFAVYTSGLGSLEAPRSHLEQTNKVAARPATVQQWGKLLADASQLQNVNKLKQLARGCGPAGPNRAQLWFLASGGADLKQASATIEEPNTYERLAGCSSALPPIILHQLEADAYTVGLHWRSHPLLVKPEGAPALARILVALMNYNPRMGSYNRSLCHMAAFILVVFGGAEHQEDAFWTLASLLQDRLFGYVEGQWQMALRIEQEVLNMLVSRKLPRLTAHLAAMRLSPASFTQSWLSALYVTCLPPVTLARVWDCMIIEGPKMLLRVSLALLKMYEQTLTSCTFPDVLKKVLDLRVSRTTDSAALLSTAFKGIGSLPGELVDSLRIDAARMLYPDSDISPPKQRAKLSTAGSTGIAGLMPGRGLVRRSSPAKETVIAPVSPAGSNSSAGNEIGSPSSVDVSRGEISPERVSNKDSNSPTRLLRSNSKKGSVGAHLSLFMARFGWGPNNNNAHIHHTDQEESMGFDGTVDNECDGKQAPLPSVAAANAAHTLTAF